MDQARFIALLQKEKILKLQGRWLYDVNKLEYSELFSYKRRLSQQVFYKNRFNYINLVKNCLAGKSNCYAFDSDFGKICSHDIKIIEEWIEKLTLSEIDCEIKFDNNSKIENFSSLLVKLSLSDSFDQGLSEKDFYQRLENVYPKMLKYAESNSVIQNDGEVLKFVMIFFIVITSFVYSVLSPTIFNLLWQSTNI